MSHVEYLRPEQLLPDDEERRVTCRHPETDLLITVIVRRSVFASTFRGSQSIYAAYGQWSCLTEAGQRCAVALADDGLELLGFDVITHKGLIRLNLAKF